jgi:hypothetical protein
VSRGRFRFQLDLPRSTAAAEAAVRDERLLQRWKRCSIQNRSDPKPSSPKTIMTQNHPHPKSSSPRTILIQIHLVPTASSPNAIH